MYLPSYQEVHYCTHNPVRKLFQADKSSLFKLMHLYRLPCVANITDTTVQGCCIIDNVMHASNLLMSLVATFPRVSMLKLTTTQSRDHMYTTLLCSA